MTICIYSLAQPSQVCKADMCRGCTQSMAGMTSRISVRHQSIPHLKNTTGLRLWNERLSCTCCCNCLLPPDELFHWKWSLPQILASELEALDGASCCSIALPKCQTRKSGTLSLSKTTKPSHMKASCSMQLQITFSRCFPCARAACSRS